MKYLLIVVLIAGSDQISKFLVVSTMDIFDSVTIIPEFFNITYITNRGAAFSLFAEIDSQWRHYFLLIAGLAAVGVLTVALFRVRKESILQSLGFAFILSGALGNSIDRIRLGEVVDFLDFHYKSYHWPAFNIADIAICIGVMIIVIYTLQERDKDQKY